MGKNESYRNFCWFGTTCPYCLNFYHFSDNLCVQEGKIIMFSYELEYIFNKKFREREDNFRKWFEEQKSNEEKEKKE